MNDLIVITVNFYYKCTNNKSIYTYLESNGYFSQFITQLSVVNVFIELILI